MPEPDTTWNRAPGRGERRWRQFSSSLPMRTALLAVGSVWILGCVWSYQEQSAFAASKGFMFPHLLPLVIDGFAVSMAGVAWAASLDARAAIPARLATVVAVAASAASNGVWAYLRAYHDMVAVALGVAVPVVANLAFEVLLAEVRRQVQRRRGLPPPVAVPYPRLIRIMLAPWQTFRAWRAVVLEITAMDHAVSRPSGTMLTAEPDVPATPAPTATTASTSTSWPARQAAMPITGCAEPALRTPTRVAPVHTAARRQVVVTAPGTATPTQLAPPAAPASVTKVAPAGVGPPRSVPTANPAPTQPTLVQGQPAPTPTTTAQDTDSNSAQLPRPTDPRVIELAQYLATIRDGDELTGEMVGPLLNLDVAPRTGRRLLGLARELLSQHAQA